MLERGSVMRVLIGSIGTLGFLLKELPPRVGPVSWRVFPNEGSLAAHLRSLSCSEGEIQNVFRLVRSEGRVVVSADAGTLAHRVATPGKSRLLQGNAG
jgi:hypothetical protein